MVVCTERQGLAVLVVLALSLTPAWVVYHRSIATFSPSHTQHVQSHAYYEMERTFDTDPDERVEAGMLNPRGRADAAAERKIRAMRADLDQKDATQAALRSRVELLQERLKRLAGTAATESKARTDFAEEQGGATALREGRPAGLQRHLADPPAIPGNHKVTCVKVHEVVDHDCNKTYYAYYTGNDHFQAHAAIKRFRNRGRTTHHTTVCAELDVNLYPKRGGHSQLMVMMSTVGKLNAADPRDAMRNKLQRGAAASWLSLKPEITTIIAVDDSTVPSPLPGFPRAICPTNALRTPYVGAIMMHGTQVAKKVGARFTGYTNGDIAFDGTVIDVLKGVASAIDDGVISDRVLLIGKRLNIDNAVDDAAELTHLSQDGLPNLRERIRSALVEMSHRSTNTWMSENSEDFFFYTENTFDWENMPDFVVGRVGWDSWLTQWAIDNGVDVIDTTQLLHVSHLTGRDGNLAGWSSPKPDRMWNYCALKSWCTKDKKHWDEFCTSCFRCKLGSSKQGAFQLSSRKGGRGRDVDVIRVPAMGGDALAKEIQYWFDVASDAMVEYKLPRSMAPHYLSQVVESQSCRPKGTCCTMQGGWAVDMEMSKLRTIRGWVPSKMGLPDLFNGTSWRHVREVTDPDIYNEIDPDKMKFFEEFVKAYARYVNARKPGLDVL